MSVSVTVPLEYGFIVLDAVVSVFLLFYLGMKVGVARKKYEIKYPQMYSDREPMFNCIQRAHQNTVENYPTFLVLMLLGGLQHPLVCAVSGLVWIVSRVVYAHGYYTGNPAKRNRGAFGYFGLLAMLGSTVSLALHLLKWL